MIKAVIENIIYVLFYYYYSIYLVLFKKLYKISITHKKHHYYYFKKYSEKFNICILYKSLISFNLLSVDVFYAQEEYILIWS